MTQFTIKKAELSRLKTFSNFVLKLKEISPASGNQLFYVNDNDKLEVYTVGDDGCASAIQQEIILDISALSRDESMSIHGFTINTDVILSVLDKFSSEDIDFSFDNQMLNITSKDSPFKFSSKLLAFKTKEEMEEIKQFIPNYLNSDLFKEPIKINVSDIRDSLIQLSALTKIFNLNKSIEISPTALKTADNFGIFCQKLANPPISEALYFHRDLAAFINDLDEILVSKDKTLWYFNFNTLGIQMIITAPSVSYIYPSEEELTYFSPADSKLILKVKSKELFNKLASFDNLFDSQWSYEQIYLKTPDDFETSKELHLSWDDKVVRVDTKLQTEIVEITDDAKDFEFIIPSKELKILASLFEKDGDEITIEYNSIPVGQQHGSGTKWYTANTIIYLPKMNF